MFTDRTDILLPVESVPIREIRGMAFDFDFRADTHYS